MKLSSETISVLQSFSKINKSIFIKSGNIIKTKPDIGNSPTAKARVEDDFPVDFAIYDLQQFLSILNLFDEPDFQFEEKLVRITDSNKRRKSVCRYAEKETIAHPPYEKDFQLPEVDTQFTIQANDLQNIKKSAAVLKMPDIAFLGDGENVFITVYNSALPVDKQDTDAFSIKIGETDRKFRMIFTVTDFVPFVEDTYDIELCFKGIAKLTSNKLTYWISPSSKSTYN